MKQILLLLSLVFVVSSFSSCTSMYGRRDMVAGTVEETKRVQDGYDTVTTERVLDSKSGLVEVEQNKVARYSNKTTKKKVICPACVRYYSLPEGCCGSNTDAARKMATAQGPSGSPHMGLIPTMKPIAP